MTDAEKLARIVEIITSDAAGYKSKGDEYSATGDDATASRCYAQARACRGLLIDIEDVLTS
jgi:hypothetical protein